MRYSRTYERRELLSLSHLLAIPPIREMVLMFVSAFDAAKLEVSDLCELTPTEKRRYLHPLRDLVWNTSEAERLFREGMKLLLLGDCAYALEQRLRATQRYIKFHGNARLQVYLLGTFPLCTTAPTALNSLVGFSTTGTPDLMRSFCDKWQVEQILAATNAGSQRSYIMSFNAPMRVSARSTKGSWYKVDDVPDWTVDLWIYVPSFQDQARQEVRFTPSDVLRISCANSMSACSSTLLRMRFPQGIISRKDGRGKVHTAVLQGFRHASTLRQILAMCMGHYQLSRWLLNSAGVCCYDHSPLVQLWSSESSAPRLFSHLGAATLGTFSDSRADMAIMQAPHVRFFLDTGCRIVASLEITLP